MKLEAGFAEVLNQLERERGIPVNDLRNAIETAFLSAYKKKFGVKDNVFVNINKNLGEISVVTVKKVVETVTDPINEIDLEKAITIFPEAVLDQEIQVPVDLKNDDFGRFAANVAKQVISQKLREAEKKQVYNEYHDRNGQVVTGTVQRLEKNNVIVKLGKHEEVLVYSEQIPGEKFRVGDRIKLFITEITSAGKASRIVLSRKTEGFVQKVFEIEVPELNEGIVAIKAIAREPGYRTKVAVHTVRGNSDPVGTCIGTRGARIKIVLDELKGEKIDVIKWSANSADFITNALSPAKVISVKILDRDRSRAHVIVPDDQLSLAIGKEGLNVKLAAKLTNFHIDIENESKAKSKAKLV